MPLRLRTHLCFESGHAGFPGLVETSGILDPELAAFLNRSQLNVISYWGNRPDINVLHVLHVASGGPAMRLLPLEGETSEFIKEHARCVQGNRALVLQLGEFRQLLLAPVTSVAGDGTKTTVFWGFVAAPGLPVLTTELLDKSQLAIILDLDETLLVANSASSFENRMESCRRARNQYSQELINPQPVSELERERLQTAVACLQKEEELLQQDAELLRQFSCTNCVKIQGKMFTPRLEPAHLEDGSIIKRPVIKLLDGLVVLTRIDPNEKKTSMLIRVRPGWEDLRRYLSGELDGKQRFDVYVCTAAERSYALEVWRLLDTAANVIPQNLRRARIVNVPSGRKKTILNSLGLLDAHTAIAASAAMADAPEGSPGSLSHPMAVVVDDRLEVWEEADQAHILQVVPWMYYKDEAARQAHVNAWTAHMSEKELARVRNSIISIRGEVYQHLDQVVKPQLDGVVADGAPESNQEEDACMPAPAIKTTRTMLKDPSWTSVYGMPRLVGPGRTPPSEEAAALTAAAYLPLSACVSAAAVSKAKGAKPECTASLTNKAPAPARAASREPFPAAPAPAAPPAEHRPAAAIQDLSQWNLDALDFDEDEDTAEDATQQPVSAATIGGGVAGSSNAGGGSSKEASMAGSSTPGTHGQASMSVDAPNIAAVGQQQQLQPEASSPEQMEALAELLDLTPGTHIDRNMVLARISEVYSHDPPRSAVLCLLLQAVSDNIALMPDARQIMEACRSKPASSANIQTFLGQSGQDGIPSRVASLAEALRQTGALAGPSQPPQAQQPVQLRPPTTDSSSASMHQAPAPLQPAAVNGSGQQQEELTGREASKSRGSKRDLAARDDGGGGRGGGRGVGQGGQSSEVSPASKKRQHPNAGGVQSEFPGHVHINNMHASSAGPPQSLLGNPTVQQSTRAVFNPPSSKPAALGTFLLEPSQNGTSHAAPAALRDRTGDANNAFGSLQQHATTCKASISGPSSNAVHDLQMVLAAEPRVEEAEDPLPNASLGPAALSLLHRMSQVRSSSLTFDARRLAHLWEVHVLWDQQQIGTGSALKKQDAKQLAAAQACKALGLDAAVVPEALILAGDYLAVLESRCPGGYTVAECPRPHLGDGFQLEAEYRGQKLHAWFRGSSLCSKSRQRAAAELLHQIGTLDMQGQGQQHTSHTGGAQQQPVHAQHMLQQPLQGICNNGTPSNGILSVPNGPAPSPASGSSPSASPGTTLPPSVQVKPKRDRELRQLLNDKRIGQDEYIVLLAILRAHDLAGVPERHELKMAALDHYLNKVQGNPAAVGRSDAIRKHMTDWLLYQPAGRELAELHRSQLQEIRSATQQRKREKERHAAMQALGLEQQQASRQGKASADLDQQQQAGLSIQEQESGRKARGEKTGQRESGKQWDREREDDRRRNEMSVCRERDMDDGRSRGMDLEQERDSEPRQTRLRDGRHLQEHNRSRDQVDSCHRRTRSGKSASSPMQKP